jgi:cytochrome c oxidase subunit II
MKRRVFTALLLSSAVGGAARLAAEESPSEINITAMKFDFIPDTIKVKRGKPVTLVLTSLDRIHGFKMPDFGIRTDIVPSEYTRVTITPEKTGTFGFLCDVFCGDGHEDMNGSLIVED